MVLAYKLFAYLSLFLKSLGGSFSFELFSYANFMNQDSNCVCDDNFVTQDMIWYAWYGMITNMHKSRCRQYSMASLDG